MEADEALAMDDAAIAEFVTSGGTGVLSLADDDVPYSTPVSYGFDPDAQVFYLRLGFLDESEKRDFLDGSALARLVIYDREGDRWRSVIATGRLERVPDSALTPELAALLQRAELPLFAIWDEPVDAIDFEIYRLDADRLTGRTAPADAG